jgi:hypothetical protein
VKVTYNPFVSTSIPPTNSDLNKEVIIVKLPEGSTPSVNLDGWSIQLDSGEQYVFDPLTLMAGAQVVLHTGKGVNSVRHRYWQRDDFLLDDTGGEARRYEHPDFELRVATTRRRARSPAHDPLAATRVVRERDRGGAVDDAYRRRRPPAWNAPLPAFHAAVKIVNEFPGSQGSGRPR